MRKWAGTGSSINIMMKTKKCVWVFVGASIGGDYSDADGEGFSAMLPPGNACVQCHDQHGDFNSTFVQFYPTIRDLVSQDSKQAH